MPTTTYPACDVTAANGVPFRVLFIPAYSVLPNHPKVPLDTVPLVEFYDARYPFTRDGQFVARYDLDTVLGISHGLILDMGVDDWRIDAGTMRTILAWLGSLTTA